jgi:hypothetical protein
MEIVTTGNVVVSDKIENLVADLVRISRDDQ